MVNIPQMVGPNEKQHSLVVSLPPIINEGGLQWNEPAPTSTNTTNGLEKDKTPNTRLNYGWKNKPKSISALNSGWINKQPYIIKNLLIHEPQY